MVTDEHPLPESPLITVTPSTFTPGTFVPNVFFQLSEPLFTGPNATVLLGPGVLVDNFQIMNPFQARADVTVGLRALSSDHCVILDTGDGPIRIGDYKIQCGPLICGPSMFNSEPEGELAFVPTPGAPFPITLFFDDLDQDIVQAEIAIEDAITTHVIFTSEYRTYRTNLSDPNPESIVAMAPVLPPGDYQAIGLLHDGLSRTLLIKNAFSVSPSGVLPGMLSLEAIPGESQIELRWSVLYQKEYVGFHVLRAEGDGAFRRITPTIIRNDASVYPAMYRWVDRTAVDGVEYAYRIEVIHLNGNPDTWNASVRATARVLPIAYALRVLGPHPVQAGENVRFAYEVPRPGGHAVVNVFDVSGRRVATLLDRHVEPGRYEAAWDGSGGFDASGVYFLSLEAGAERRVERIVRIR